MYNGSNRSLNLDGTSYPHSCSSRGGFHQPLHDGQSEQQPGALQEVVFVLQELADVLLQETCNE